MTSSPDLHIVEASIADLRHALEEGAVSSVDLIGTYLGRIAVVGGLGGAAVGAATTPEPRYNRYGYY